MIKHWQSLIRITGILSLGCLILMIISHFVSNDSIQEEILIRYLSIPFWTSICLLLIFIALYLFMMVHDHKINFSTSLLAVLLLASGGFIGYREAICPLLDLSYVNDPQMIRLDHLQFYYSNLADSPTIQLYGYDQSGEKMNFEISYETYEQGKQLYEELQEMSGSYNVIADIKYLPYSEMVTDICMWIEEM
ncbi:hypothetical protein [Traorella massiliensis]|uniref:hypothetical protein n=1 Tax=Traorella massiliensis TaxID=1903263 RepID=UPI0023529BBF|nr:hypothetical protein [Traorella massiliensis]